MKNVKTVTGILKIVKRLKRSTNGNPRFLVEVNGQQFSTKPNCDLAYIVEVFNGELVNMDVGNYYGKPSVNYIELKEITKGNITNKTPQECYIYARDIIKGRWPEGEPMLATDPLFSYLYAKYILQTRFIEGEAAIATDSMCSYRYARDVVRGAVELIL